MPKLLELTEEEVVKRMKMWMAPWRMSLGKTIKMDRMKTRRWRVLDERLLGFSLLLAIRRSRTGMRVLGYGVGYGQAFVADMVPTIIDMPGEAKGFDSGGLTRDIHIICTTRFPKKISDRIDRSPTP
jgi:hypothetical protein